MEVKTVSISREENAMVRKLIESHCAAIKNWLASSVEGNNIENARDLVRDLRKYEKLYHTFVPDCMFRGN